MSKVPISVCIIAKNEEKHIEECLKHLKPYGFEIVVTDTGSTDHTKEIAAQYADKVLDFEWINDFSAARNYCADQASNNWILAIDCDEYLEKIDLPLVRIGMQRYPREVCMIMIQNMFYTENRETRYASDPTARFYNRNFIHFESPVHEQLHHIGHGTDDEKDRAIIIFPIEVIHHGYLLPKEEMDKKQRRNLELLYAEYQKNPQDSYICFQIGQSEIILGNETAGIEYYEKALACEPDPEYTYVQMLIEGLATAYAHTDRKKEALELMERYQSKCKGAKYVFVQANLYMDNDMPMKALLNYIKAVSMNDTPMLGEELLHCYQNIIYLYNEMGQPDMAEMFVPKYKACLAERNRVMNA